MKISRANAVRLWEKHYGNTKYAEDYHGYLMCREGYGDEDFFIIDAGERIYCGWNLHHVFPVALGGTNAVSNLVCTNIETNRLAGEKTTYWIDDRLYQVRRIFGERNYEIVRLK